MKIEEPKNPHLRALLDYCGGIYSMAIEYRVPPHRAAEFVKHIESAARGLDKQLIEAVELLREAQLVLADHTSYNDSGRDRKNDDVIDADRKIREWLEKVRLG